MFNRRIKFSCAPILRNAYVVLALLLVTEPTQAQTNEPAQVETKPAPIAPGQSLPRLRRGPDGKIIVVPENDESGRDADSKPKPDRRIGPGLDSATSPARTAPERLSPDHPLRALMDQVDLLRREYERLAQREQFEIERVAREERLRNPTGPIGGPTNLGVREREMLEKLKSRDRDIHDHTAQQFQLGKPYSVAPEYFQVRGPDGRRYAVAGLVRFDPGRSDTAAREMIRRLEIIKRAAMVRHRLTDNDVKIIAEIDRAIAYYHARQ